MCPGGNTAETNGIAELDSGESDVSILGNRELDLRSVGGRIA